MRKIALFFKGHCDILGDKEVKVWQMLDLFVLDGIKDEKIPAYVEAAIEEDFASTKDW